MGIGPWTEYDAWLAENSNPFRGERCKRHETPHSFDHNWWVHLNGHELLVALGAQSISCIGEQMRARCPYPDHIDHSPSFFINLTKPGLPFFCFGCLRGGNAITLVQDLGFPLAVLNEHGATLDLSRTRRQRSENNWRGAGRRERFWNTWEQKTQILKLLEQGPQERVRVRRWVEMNWDVKKRQANNILSQMIRRGMLDKDGTMLYSVRQIIRNDGQFLNTKESYSYSSLVLNNCPPLRLCDVCNRPLSGRSDKKYCDDKCKQSAYRARMKPMESEKTPSRFNPNIAVVENLKRSVPHLFEELQELEEYRRLGREEHRKHLEHLREQNRLQRMKWIEDLYVKRRAEKIAV